MRFKITERIGDCKLKGGMETISILFSGSAWIYLLLVVVAGAAATFTYARTQPEISRPWKIVLATLRTLALALLLITLFEPVLRYIRSEQRAPRLAVLVDVSRSAGMKDLGGDRAASMRAAASTLFRDAGSDADVILFDARSRTLEDPSVDSLQFNGQRTDISAALRSVSNAAMERSYGAVVLVSDGTITAGDNPIYGAERSGLPVYTVGVGDTTQPKDVVAMSLNANAVCYIGQAVPISVELRSSGFAAATSTVVLMRGNTEIGRQDVAIRSGSDRTSLTFSYTPTQAGMQKITAKVLDLPGEFSTRNNSVVDYITVLEKKRRVVLIAGAPSADVTFVRAALQRNKDLEIVSFVQKQGAEFYEGVPTAAAFMNAEACVLIGFPIASSPASVVDVVATAAQRGCSLMFIPSQATDYGKLGALADVLPFTVAATRSNEMMVSSDVQRSATSDPILKIVGDDDDAKRWNDLPPVYRTETFVRAAPQSTILATSRVNNVPMQEPLIMKRETDRVKSLAVLAYGLYRWKLLGVGPGQARGTAVTDVFSQFIDNSMQWLSVREDAKHVRIKPGRLLYASGELVEFTASVTDASYAPVDGADVSVTIKGNGIEKRIEMAPQANGRYASVVGVLPAGDYTYTGKATAKGQDLGSDNGSFSVSDLSIEYASTTMDIELLRQLAARTGGTFTRADSVEGLISAIRANPRFKATTVTSERETALWSLPWLLAASIAMFATEWFLRKRRGLV